jgi:hypothetical protein
MASSGLDLRAFVRLVDRAERLYPYVTAQRLRRLARSEDPNADSAARLGPLIRGALDESLLLYDRRQRIRRDGTAATLLVYRLNRRHSRLPELLRGG